MLNNTQNKLKDNQIIELFIEGHFQLELESLPKTLFRNDHKST